MLHPEWLTLIVTKVKKQTNEKKVNTWINETKLNIKLIKKLAMILY